jgi:CARDB
MSSNFSKFGRLAAVVTVLATLLSQVALAKGKFGISLGVPSHLIRSNLRFSVGSYRTNPSSRSPRYSTNRQTAAPTAPAPAAAVSTTAAPAPAAPAAPPAPSPVVPASVTTQVVTSETTRDFEPADGTAASPDSAIETGPTDLLLEDLQYVEPATQLVGPAYRVKFRNQGMSAVGQFRVALVAAAGGKASKNSPRAVVEVAGLAAGHAGEVTMRLPKTALTPLSTSASQPTRVTHLLVVVDLDGTVNESDKTNNFAIVERAQLEAAAR